MDKILATQHVSIVIAVIAWGFAAFLSGEPTVTRFLLLLIMGAVLWALRYVSHLEGNAGP